MLYVKNLVQIKENISLYLFSKYSIRQEKEELCLIKCNITNETTDSIDLTNISQNVKILLTPFNVAHLYDCMSLIMIVKFKEYLQIRRARKKLPHLIYRVHTVELFFDLPNLNFVNSVPKSKKSMHIIYAVCICMPFKKLLHVEHLY